MTIDALFERTFDSSGNDHLLVVFGKIGEKLAARILAETGVDVADFELTIDNYGIRHTMEGHGNAAAEAAHGQIAVSKNDFLRLLEIIENADFIFLSTRQKSPRSPIIESLIFEKQIDDFFYVVKEVRRVRKKGKTNRLMLQTMYKTKKRRVF